MNKPPGPDSGKTPARLAAEQGIKDRLQTSTRRQRVGVGAGLLLGVAAQA